VPGDPARYELSAASCGLPRGKAYVAGCQAIHCRLASAGLPAGKLWVAGFRAFGLGADRASAEA